jgi:hypothetical protein
MGGLKLAGVLWIIGGVSSAGMAFGVWEDGPIMLALALGGAIVGLAIGALLITRPGPEVVRWSNVAGLAWLIAFGALTVVEVVMQMGYALSVVRILGFGLAGALVAYSRRAAAASA